MGNVITFGFQRGTAWGYLLVLWTLPIVSFLCASHFPIWSAEHIAARIFRIVRHLQHVAFDSNEASFSRKKNRRPLRLHGKPKMSAHNNWKWGKSKSFGLGVCFNCSLHRSHTWCSESFSFVPTISQPKLIAPVSGAAIGYDTNTFAYVQPQLNWKILATKYYYYRHKLLLKRSVTRHKNGASFPIYSMQCCSNDDGSSDWKEPQELNEPHYCEYWK